MAEPVASSSIFVDVCHTTIRYPALDRSRTCRTRWSCQPLWTCPQQPQTFFERRSSCTIRASGSPKTPRTVALARKSAAATSPSSPDADRAWKLVLLYHPRRKVCSLLLALPLVARKSHPFANDFSSSFLYFHLGFPLQRPASDRYRSAVVRRNRHLADVVFWVLIAHLRQNYRELRLCLLGQSNQG